MTAGLRQCVARKTHSQYSWILASIVAGALAGVAFAQERMPGQPDAACTSWCIESGEDADSCDKVCWVPDIPTRVRPEEVTDAVCLRSCLEKGGRFSDCKPRCRLPPAQ
jgi:hypothetical protein